MASRNSLVSYSSTRVLYAVGRGAGGSSLTRSVAPRSSSMNSHTFSSWLGFSLYPWFATRLMVERLTPVWAATAAKLTPSASRRCRSSSDRFSLAILQHSFPWL